MEVKVFKFLKSVSRFSSRPTPRNDPLIATGLDTEWGLQSGLGLMKIKIVLLPEIVPQYPRKLKMWKLMTNEQVSMMNERHE
jgi:hypothetical protein